MAITYTVYRDGVKVAEGLTEKTYTDTGLTPNTTYGYQVSAVNEFGESELSEVVEVTTEAEQIPPETPTGLEATDITDTEIELGWQDN